MTMKPVKPIKRPAEYPSYDLEFKTFKLTDRVRGGAIVNSEFSITEQVLQCLSIPDFERNEDGSAVMDANGRAKPLRLTLHKQKSLWRIKGAVNVVLDPVDVENKAIEEENRKSVEEYNKKVQDQKDAGVKKEEIDKIPMPGQKPRIGYGEIKIQLRSDDALYLAEKMLGYLNDFTSYVPGITGTAEYFEGVKEDCGDKDLKV